MGREVRAVLTKYEWAPDETALFTYALPDGTTIDEVRSAPLPVATGAELTHSYYDNLKLWLKNERKLTERKTA